MADVEDILGQRPGEGFFAFLRRIFEDIEHNGVIEDIPCFEDDPEKLVQAKGSKIPLGKNSRCAELVCQVLNARFSDRTSKLSDEGEKKLSAETDAWLYPVVHDGLLYVCPDSPRSSEALMVSSIPFTVLEYHYSGFIHDILGDFDERTMFSREDLGLPEKSDDDRLLEALVEERTRKEKPPEEIGEAVDKGKLYRKKSIKIDSGGDDNYKEQAISEEVNALRELLKYHGFEDTEMILYTDELKFEREGVLDIYITSEALTYLRHEEKWRPRGHSLGFEE